MPPAADAMNTLRPLLRSSTMPRYNSRAMGSVSSISSRCTFLPSGPVWCVISVMPSILLGQFDGLFRRLGDLHAAAFAAPSGVDLRLDHHSGCAFVEEFARRRIGFLGALDHVPARHSHSVLRQDCLALVLVNFHVGMTDAGDLPAALAAEGRIVCSL